MTVLATTREEHVSRVTNSILAALDGELYAIRASRHPRDARGVDLSALLDAVNAVEHALLLIEAFARGDR